MKLTIDLDYATMYKLAALLKFHNAHQRKHAPDERDWTPESWLEIKAAKTIESECERWLSPTPPEKPTPKLGQIKYVIHGFVYKPDTINYLINQECAWFDGNEVDIYTLPMFLDQRAPDDPDWFDMEQMELYADTHADALKQSQERIKPAVWYEQPLVQTEAEYNAECEAVDD